ncbi:MAG: response regulator receiver protein [Hydrogenophilales bacterium 32-62-9]|nr:MAG: response regulator receiver protein [Hydrogenophilales bacterium 32-62-9]
MKIVVVEDSSLVLDNLIEILSSYPGLSVIGHARGEDEAYALILSSTPDVVLLDLELSPGSGIKLLKRIRAAGLPTRVLVFTNQPADPYQKLCLEAGADAYFEKSGDLNDLLLRLAQWMPPLPINEKLRLRALNRLDILDTPDEAVFSAITRLAAAVVEAPIALISLVDAERQWFKARVGLDIRETSRTVSFCAHALVNGELLEIEDASLDERFADNPVVRGEAGIRFYAGMPLVLPGGEVVGTLCVVDRVPRKLNATQRMTLEVLARNVVTELELRDRIRVLETEVALRHEAEIRIMHLATRDPLTGLPNRAALMDRLQHGLKSAKRDQTQLGVLFLDLDRFKWTNDTLGHDVGDALLQVIAERLTALLRESDTVARLGGDEFAILLPALHHADEAVQVAQKIINAIAQPMNLKGHSVQVGCSAGVAVYPLQGETEDTLLRHADLSMYHAKELGGNQYQVFSDEMNVRALERMTLETDLRLAIESGQLEMYYQPQVRLVDQELTGLEALVRWNHPRLGFLPPDRFIPLAEDSGLIWALGLEVLDQAVAQIAEWMRQGLQVPRVAVNVSPAQLRDGLLDAVVATLRKHDVPAAMLELELTESALTSDGPAVLGLLQSLRDMGVAIAVDDFGVGYSSLALLRRLPITTLKIDRSFVSELASNHQDIAIVEAVITMANSMGLRTVAEGVEEQAQDVALRVLGCNDAQGYLYSKPAAVAVATSWLTSLDLATPRLSA